MKSRPEAPTGLWDWRRVAMTLVVLLAAGAPLAALSACGGGNGGAASVQSRVQQEEKAFQHQDWQTLYSLASPRARSGCTYDQFRTAIQNSFQGTNIDWSKLQFKNVKVSTTGNTASVSGTETYNGQDLSSGPETWVKVNGTWYDDAGGSSACNLGSSG